MTDAALAPLEPPRRLHLDWVPAVLFRPRQAFQKIASIHSAVWLTPILILTVTALLLVGVSGRIKTAAAASGQVELPQEFQYYTPEQQAQFQQAMAATSSPVFIYVFPAIVAVLRVWLGWLVVGGLLHLVLTLLGGRGDTGSAMNLVAWASLPFAVRDLVRAGAMLAANRLIASPGLSGFAPLGGGNLDLFLKAFLTLIDIYVIWQAVLLVIGVRAGNGLPVSKAAGGALLTLALVLTVQALLIFAQGKMGGMTIIRPFF